MEDNEPIPFIPADFYMIEWYHSGVFSFRSQLLFDTHDEAYIYAQSVNRESSRDMSSRIVGLATIPF